MTETDVLNPHSIAAIEARLAACTPGYWVAGIDIEPDDGRYWAAAVVYAVDELPVPDVGPEGEEEDFERVSAWDDTHCRGHVAETHNYFSIPDEEHNANQRLIGHAKEDLRLLVDVAKAAANFLECGFPGAGRYEAAARRLAESLAAVAGAGHVEDVPLSASEPTHDPKAGCGT